MDAMLNIKRALLVGGSLVVGFVIATAIVYGPMETDIDTYSRLYYILTGLPIGIIFLIWGDALLGTKILPD